MNPYNNIFTSYSKKENKVTKVFLNLLELIQQFDDSYTPLFLEKVVKVNENVCGYSFSYTHQGIKKYRNFQDDKAVNYLLCISEKNQVTLQKSEKISSTPDGGIFSKGGSTEFNIAIETKIGKKGELNTDQLENHLKHFGQKTPIIVYITWDDVRSFFKENIPKQNRKIISVLIEQFEDFCLIYDIGTNTRNREFWLKQFHEYNEIARDIDNFLMNGELGYPVFEQISKDDGINYNGKENSGGKRFAKLHVNRDKYMLILTYCSKNYAIARNIQEEYKLPTIEENKTGHELWIPLEWIETGKTKMDIVKELCIAAYKKRYPQIISILKTST